MTPRSSNRITILVEGATDKSIVGYILEALDREIAARVDVVQCSGKRGVKAAYHEAGQIQRVVALVDADEPSVPDAEAWAREFFETTEPNVFCAVPTIEAWVFADKELALRNARQSKYARATIGRLVTPESLANPKHLLNQVFDRQVIQNHFRFIKDINIGRAVGASTSLFRFLRGVETALGNEWMYAEQRLSEAFNRKVFANLLREIPADTIGWKTLSGDYTAEQLGDLVLQGDEVGLRYVSELLRLARDILAARAKVDTKGQSNA